VLALALRHVTVGCCHRPGFSFFLEKTFFLVIEKAFSRFFFWKVLSYIESKHITSLISAASKRKVRVFSHFSVACCHRPAHWDSITTALQFLALTVQNIGIADSIIRLFFYCTVQHIGIALQNFHQCTRKPGYTPEGVARSISEARLTWWVGCGRGGWEGCGMTLFVMSSWGVGVLVGQSRGAASSSAIVPRTPAVRRLWH
jgi:hypothetical protein